MTPTLPLLMQLVSRRASPATGGRPPRHEELAWLLRAATTVPDHGSLRPWRFVLVTGDERDRLGDALAGDVLDAQHDVPPSVLAKARHKALAAPVLIILVASPRPGSKVPRWEQMASAACCGYAIVLAAHTLGLGAVWKSTALRDGPRLRALCQLADHEELLGWVNVGGITSPDERELRPPPDLATVASVVGADGLRPFV